MQGFMVVLLKLFICVGIVVLVAAIALGFPSYHEERGDSLEVLLTKLQSPGTVPMFPLAAFSPEGHFAFTYEETITHAPYNGYGGFQIYTPSTEGFSLSPSLRIKLPGEEWAHKPLVSIGGVTLLWNENGLIMGPDLGSSLGYAQSTRTRLHVSHEDVFVVDDKELTLIQLALPEQVDIGGSMTPRGEMLFVYDMVDDSVVVFEGKELVQRSKGIGLNLMPWYVMSVFHTNGFSEECERRNLWLPGFTTGGQLVGVSRADGEVFLFDESTLLFERLGSASLGQPVWQPGFADDTLIVASDPFDRNGKLPGVRLERWTFRPDGIVKQGTVLEDLKHSTLLPFGVALRDSRHGVLFGVGSNGILQAFTIND